MEAPFKDKMMISVIICTFNRSEIIIDSLKSFTNITPPGCPFEILVVDNNSRDDTLLNISKFIQKHKMLPIHLIKEKRQGLSFAKNRGIRESKGNLLFFLDDDAIIDSKCLALYRHYYEDMGFKCMGGKILPWFRDNSLQIPDWFTNSHWGALSMLDIGDKIKRVFYPEFPHGGNIAVEKQLFEKFGDFYENLGRKNDSLESNEEMEFMLRLEKFGIPIYYVPDAKIYHLVQKERLTKMFFFKRLYAQGTSDAYMFTINKRKAATIRNVPQRLLELSLSPINYIIKKRKNKPEYSMPILRIPYNLGYLVKTIKLIVQREVQVHSNS